MAKDLAVGQFWRDTVNEDVLKITAFNETVLESGPTLYVQCACYPRGEYLLGIQEMRAMHLDGVRFKRIGKLKMLWFRLKFALWSPAR